MNLGVLLILVFVTAGAARDVFFGGVFQQFRFFEVVLVAFGMATAVFLVALVLFHRHQLAAIAGAWREAVATNLGTAAAWLSFFFALKLLEPAVVQTLHFGMGSVTLVLMGALGLHIARPARIRPIEAMVQVLILATLAALAAVVMLDLSGLPDRPTANNALGIALALASGVFISLSTDVTKRMNERGVSPEGVLAVRFIGIILVAGIAVAISPDNGEAARLGDWRAVTGLAAAAMVLVVLPLYALQLGLARTSSVSAWVLMALGPCMVFAIQGLDDRLDYSPYTLGCIVAFSGLAIASNLVREFERAAAKG